MAYLDQYGTVLEAWFPLGGRGNTQVYLNDPTVKVPPYYSFDR